VGGRGGQNGGTTSLLSWEQWEQNDGDVLSLANSAGPPAFQLHPGGSEYEKWVVPLPATLRCLWGKGVFLLG
jgi:hypothetical protein